MTMTLFKGLKDTNAHSYSKEDHTSLETIKLFIQRGKTPYYDLPDKADYERIKAEEVLYFLPSKVDSRTTGTIGDIERDLIIMDLDGLRLTVEELAQLVKDKLGNNLDFIIYPTLGHNTRWAIEKEWAKGNVESGFTRVRLVMAPTHSYRASEAPYINKYIADQLGIKYDTASNLGTQVMGLPVTTNFTTEADTYINNSDDGKTFDIDKALEGVTKNALTRTRKKLVPLVEFSYTLAPNKDFELYHEAIHHKGLAYIKRESKVGGKLLDYEQFLHVINVFASNVISGNLSLEMAEELVTEMARRYARHSYKTADEITTENLNILHHDIKGGSNSDVNIIDDFLHIKRFPDFYLEAIGAIGGRTA
jgi:hypothetical protein